MFDLVMDQSYFPSAHGVDAIRGIVWPQNCFRASKGVREFMDKGIDLEGKINFTVFFEFTNLKKLYEQQQQEKHIYL